MVSLLKLLYIMGLQSAKFSRLFSILIACALAAAGQCFLTLDQCVHLAWSAVVLSVPFLAFGLYDSHNKSGLPTTGRALQTPSSSYVFFGILAVAISGPVIITAAYSLASAWQKNLFTWAPLLVGATIILGMGTDLLQGYWRGVRVKSLFGNLWNHKTELAALGAIVIIGATLRFYRLDYFPPADGIVSVEENHFAGFAFNIVHNQSRPWLWIQSSYPGALFFYLFGDKMLSLRLMSAFIGTATIIPLHLLLRKLASTPVALFASALFAVSHWHAVYSRYGHNVYHGVFYVMVCLAVLVYARSSQRLSLWILLGFCLGLQVYDYDAFKWPSLLIPIYLTLSYGLEFARQRPRKLPSFILTSGTRPLLALAVMAVVVAPTLTLAFHDPNSFFNGPARMLVGQGMGYYDTNDWGAFFLKRWERMGDVVQFFNGHPQRTAYVRMNLERQSFLDPFSGVLFLLGFFYTVLFPLRLYHAFFLVAFLMTVLGGGLLHDIFDVQRMSGAAPLCFVLIGFFVEAVLNKIRAIAKPANARRAAAVGMSVVFLLSAYVNVARIDRIVNNENLRAGFKDHYTVLVSELNHITPENDYIIIVARYTPNLLTGCDHHWAMSPALRGRVTSDIFDLPNLLREVPPDRSPVLLFQKPYDLNLILDWLLSAASDLQCLLSPKPEDFNFQVLRCKLSAGQAEALSKLPMQGLKASYQAIDEARELSYSRSEPFIDRGTIPHAFLENESLRDRRYRGIWKGNLLAPFSTSYVFHWNVYAGTGRLLIDGKEVGAGQQVMLKKGEHSFEFSAIFEKHIDNGVKISWEAPANFPAAPIPFWKFSSSRQSVNIR